MSEQSWWEMTLFQIGSALCLPVILVGQQLVQAYGWRWAIIAIVGGNSILTALGIFMAVLSLHRRTSTSETVARYLGDRLSKLCAIALLISLIGWYALQFSVMSQWTTALFKEVHIPIPAGIVTALLMLLTMVVVSGGMRRMSAWATWVVPFALIPFGYLIYHTIKNSPHMMICPIAWGWAGVSLVIATSLQAMLDVPTFYRHARTERHALFSIIVVSTLAVPLIQLGGVLVGLYSPNIVFACQTGFLGITSALFMIITGIIINANSLYSATTSLMILRPRLSQWHSLIFVTIVGSLLGLSPICENFSAFIECLSFALTAIGALLVCHMTFIRFGMKHHEQVDVFAVLMGILVGCLSLLSLWRFSSIAQIDVFITTAIIGCLSRVFLYAHENQRKRVRQN